MPRFVILEHDHPSLHWDLMLDDGEALRTWRLAEPPRAGCVVSAALIAPHRRMYLDYEGEVSGGRGLVKRWDRGEFEWIEDRAERVCVALVGQKLRGMLTMLSAGEKWIALLAGGGEGA